MSIPSGQLELIITNTELVLVQNRQVIRSTYKVIVPSFDVVLDEIILNQYIGRPDQFEAKDDELYKQALSWFESVKEWHKSRVQLDDYSFHDAALILNQWTIEPDGDNWTLSHPICGDFNNVSILVGDSGRPTLQGRLTAIISRVLSPSTWGFAESESPEEITVNSIAVQGASSYNVYSDLGNGNFVLLGNVPDNNYRTLTGITAGSYRVRIAAVTGGTVGILGNENIVQVQAINGAEAFSAMSVPEQPPKRSTKTVIPSTTKPSLLNKIKSRLGR